MLCFASIWLNWASRTVKCSIPPSVCYTKDKRVPLSVVSKGLLVFFSFFPFRAERLAGSCEFSVLNVAVFVGKSRCSSDI